ncbi:MAG TPA: FAD-dependent oxidoreductase, partial [Agitococcus sp.]|nr:FAD-dependent oxidoreductase [Agitococcus sp.]
MKVAIIGSGITGLSAAWLLARHHNVTLFEANDYAGGHSNAVDVSLDGMNYPVDTGFLVFNRKTYPNLTQLFSLLDVETADTDMGFSVRLPKDNIEWSGSNLSSLFAQKANMFRPRFWLMISDILRFNKNATRLLALAQAQNLSLGQLLKAENYSESFAQWYLLPMGAAIWSTPSKDMLNFPAESFLQFCINHGLLQIKDRPQWMTVTGSSRQYVKKMCAGIGDVRLNHAVYAIERTKDGVLIQHQYGEDFFDKVVLATHSDQSLALLGDASSQEKSILSAIKYAPNTAFLHTDSSLMPKNKAAWAAWNYYNSPQDNNNAPVAVTYWLNKLQPLPFKSPLFVTLNPPEPIAQKHIIKSFDYAHP